MDWYLPLAVAFVRGHCPDAPSLPDEDLVAWGRTRGLGLHKFKRNAALPRVRRVIGMLRSLGPATVLDIGSGRGTFLWPLLDAFPDLRVVAVDPNPIRTRDLRAVRDGGIGRLSVLEGDAATLDLPAADVVTCLEVLEHVEDPHRLARRLLGAARRAVIASVPSQPDQNPEHRRLFSVQDLEALWTGADRVTVDHVLDHRIALVRPAGRVP